MKRRRSAFTLIELIVAMAIFSAIFGVVAMTLFGMQKTCGEFTDGITAANSQDRFARQLRSDSHRADDAVVQQGAAEDRPDSTLELSLSQSEVVRYELLAKQIVRRVLSDGQVVHRESFDVVPVLEKGWTVDKKRGSPLLTVYLQQRRVRGTEHIRESASLQINAALRWKIVSELTTPATATP